MRRSKVRPKHKSKAGSAVVVAVEKESTVLEAGGEGKAETQKMDIKQPAATGGEPGKMAVNRDGEGETGRWISNMACAISVSSP